MVDWKQPDVSLGPDGSADAVLTFRNLHGWIRDGVLDNVLSACQRVLKSGAILGIEEHRAKPNASTDAKVIGDTGYVPEAFVIQAVESHGFKLAAKSEINANPKDTTDHPKGVWTLPPTLRLGDVDREKYLAIGESDRMTLEIHQAVTRRIVTGSFCSSLHQACCIYGKSVRNKRSVSFISHLQCAVRQNFFLCQVHYVGLATHDCVLNC